MPQSAMSDKLSVPAADVHHSGGGAGGAGGHEKDYWTSNTSVSIFAEDVQHCGGGTGGVGGAAGDGGHAAAARRKVCQAGGDNQGRAGGAALAGKLQFENHKTHCDPARVVHASVAASRCVMTRREHKRTGREGSLLIAFGHDAGAIIYVAVQQGSVHVYMASATLSI